MLLWSLIETVIYAYRCISQIVGETYAVKKALYQVASRLHDNPSRSQHLLLSSPSIYRSGSALVNPGVGAPLISSLAGPYRGYKGVGGDHSASVKEFSLHLVCPNENIGAVIGKGGGIIKQIRQESGASIKVDTSVAEGDECIISVSAKEVRVTLITRYTFLSNLPKQSVTWKNHL